MFGRYAILRKVQERYKGDVSCLGKSKGGVREV